MKAFLKLIYFVMMFFAFFTSQAYAEKNFIDAVPVAIKALEYVRSLDRGNDFNIGIVYNSSDIVASKNAKMLQDTLKNDIKSFLVPVNTLEKNAQFNVYFVVGDLETNYPDIKRISEKNHILSLGFDAACARAEACAICVEFESGVKIYLNEDALEEMGHDIDSTFRYLAIRL